MKKLSPAQQKVIDLLNHYPESYIKTSVYYDFYKIVIDGQQHYEFFKKPTFDVLLRKGLIQVEDEGIYILV